MIAHPLRKIVIAGGGSAGWMAAASLANALERDCRIELVESDEIGTVGVGEATIPPIRSYFRDLGISEEQLLAETGATAKLGIEFVSWSRPGSRYFHPFGVYGIPFDRAPFHQWWLKESSHEPIGSLDEYSMAAALASRGRFGRPTDDPRNVMSTFDYAFHLDAGLMAAMLRRHAEARGVVRQEGKIVAVERGEDGDIVRLLLNDQRKVDGDFFIDCTGFSSLLLGGALGVQFEDWGHWLPCDGAIAVPSAASSDPPPFTRSTATEGGWQWRIPLQHRCGNGHVFCSSFMEAEHASSALLASLGTEAIGEPRLLRFRTGRRTAPWTRNCLAVGLAAGFMEPLESTSLHLIQSALTRFVALFPDRQPDPLRLTEFNQLSGDEWERIRDFLILHYHLNQRDGSLWQHCREMRVPDELSYRLAHFRARGRLVSPGPELFLNSSWLALLVGQEAVPERWDAIVDQRGNVPARDRLNTLRRLNAEMAEAAAPHSAWLAATNRARSIPAH